MEKFKRIGEKIGEKVDLKILAFKVFDDPRPKYVSKISIIDRVIDVVFLWMIPESVRPNIITVFRIITIPFLIYFLFAGFYKIAIVLFVISAFSDAIDGAMARTRNQITDWGIVFDPFADKLLIGCVGGILIYRFLSPALAIIIIFIELILMLSSYYRFKGRVVPAKTVGKIKMILQCVGVGLILLFLVVGAPFILTLAAYTLYLAVLFAILSVSVYHSI